MRFFEATRGDKSRPFLSLYPRAPTSPLVNCLAAEHDPPPPLPELLAGIHSRVVSDELS